MNCIISSISYSPIKSLSFKIVKSCFIKKNIGILNDRIFALSKNISFEKAKIIEQSPNERKLSYFLTLKNTPILNRYNFEYSNNELNLSLNNERIFSVKINDQYISSLITNKFFELEKSLKGPFFLLKNKNFPFYDTTHSNKILNSISLINLSSVNDFEEKIDQKIESERFRGNFYIKGLDAWAEREWINKTIKINDVFFKVEKNIPRCSATNLKPNTVKKTIDLPNLLKKNYGHIEMGVYLIPLNDGNVKTGNKIELKFIN
mgnify:FL=1|tara:strand:+ start:173 stop:958 length:786 start_codon:yes stop_codon:yes gene_type:complete